MDARQVMIVDADTIKIGAESIRLAGFDAPETDRAKSEHEWYMGKAATQRLEQLLKVSKNVRMERLPQPDIHGRTLARLYVDGRDVADIAVKEGWGVPFVGNGRRRSNEMPDWGSMQYPRS